MTVTYQPPLTGGPAHPGEALLREPINEGPAYLRGPRMGRWHRIRSAALWLHEWSGELVEHYYLWCGQHASSHPGKSGVPIFTDDLPDGQPSCGTCEGRAIGADPDRPEWLFQPATTQVPPRCPGSSTLLVAEDQTTWRYATCLVCRDVVRMRASGGPYASRWGAQTHPPGPGLVDPCPFHAWRELVLVKNSTGDTAAACRCQTIPTQN